MPDPRTRSWAVTSPGVFRLCSPGGGTPDWPFPVSGLSFLLAKMRGVGLTPAPSEPWKTSGPGKPG